MGVPSASLAAAAAANSRLAHTPADTKRPWLGRATTLAALVLLALCVLIVLDDSRGSRLLRSVAERPQDQAYQVAETVQRQRPSLSSVSGGGWLLLAAHEEPRTVRRASGESPAPAKTGGFKWASGAILDDFALGMDPQDRADNYGGEPPAAAGRLPESGAFQLAQLNSSGVGVEPARRPAEQVIDNISYSKTRKDLAEARERRERASTPFGSSYRVVVLTTSNTTSTPPAESQPNVSLSAVGQLDESSTRAPNNSSNNDNQSNNKINGVSSSGRLLNALNVARRQQQPHSGTIRTARKRRRAGPSANERK
jgi:hypothetical protein